MVTQTKFTTENFTLSDLPNDRFRMALLYWQSVRGMNELPPISAIDVTKIPRMLVSNLAMVDIEDGPKTFRVRLVGDGVFQGVGDNYTGKFFDDVPRAEQVLERYRLCMQTRRPNYSEGPVAWSVHHFKTFKGLAMPFSGADNTVRRILSYIEFF